MDYFPHDTHALSDDKLLALRLHHGGEAVYCYWSLLEKIYADEAPFDLSETNVEAMSVLYRLGVGLDVLKKYVSTMLEVGLLFAVNGDQNVVMSERAQQHIEQLDKKRETARQNGKKHSAKPSAKRTKKQRRTDVGTNIGTNVAVNKTLNVVGSDKQNQTTTDNGAGGGKPAPNLSKAERDTAAQRALIDEMQSTAIACPPDVLEMVKAGVS